MLSADMIEEYDKEKENEENQKEKVNCEAYEKSI